MRFGGALANSQSKLYVRSRIRLLAAPTNHVGAGRQRGGGLLSAALVATRIACRGAAEQPGNVPGFYALEWKQCENRHDDASHSHMTIDGRTP